MNKVLIVVDNLEKGGVACVAQNFCFACEKNSKITFDYATYFKPNEKVIKNLQKRNSQIFVISRIKETTPKQYIKNIRMILSRKGPYIAIHAHTAYGIWLAMLAAKKENINIRVGHAHGSKGPYSSILVKIIECIGRVLNRKYCTHMYACAEKSGVYTFGKKVEFLPNIIDEETAIEVMKKNEKNKSEVLKELSIPDDSIILGSLGLIGLEKNTKFLILLIKKLLLKNSNYFLLIAGSGPDEIIIQKLISEYNLEKHVKMLGQKNDKFKLLLAYDLLLMPSFSEGMSLAILEAQFCGTPCITSPGIPKTNDVGLKLFYQCKSFNCEEWYEKINAALSNLNQTTIEERVNKFHSIGYDEVSISKHLINTYIGNSN